MKIKAFVTIVANSTDGEAIQIEPGKVGDVQQDVAERLIEQGYAEKASKKDDVTAGPVKRKKPAAVQTTTGAKKPTKKEKTKRTREQLLGPDSDPDKGRGENGKGFDENDNEDEDNED